MYIPQGISTDNALLNLKYSGYTAQTNSCGNKDKFCKNFIAIRSKKKEASKPFYHLFQHYSKHWFYHQLTETLSIYSQNVERGLPVTAETHRTAGSSEADAFALEHEQVMVTDFSSV